MSRETDYKVLREVLSTHDFDGGWAVEFGVFTGYSLGIIAAEMPVIGFDSFNGLPEDWRDGFRTGKFAAKMPSVPPNGMIIPGLFEETTPGFPFPTLGLVHIDCDLYSSTVTALQAVFPYLGSESIIVFDEYRNYPGFEDHEMKAWTEFCEQNNVEAEEIAQFDQEAAFLITSIDGSF